MRKGLPDFSPPPLPSFLPCPPFFEGASLKSYEIKRKKKKKKKRRHVVKAAGVRFTKCARARVNQAIRSVGGCGRGGGVEFYDGFSINHLIILYPRTAGSYSKYCRFETRHRFVLVEFSVVARPRHCVDIKRSPCARWRLYIYIYIYISMLNRVTKRVARLPFHLSSNYYHRFAVDREWDDERKDTRDRERRKIGEASCICNSWYLY